MGNLISGNVDSYSPEFQEQVSVLEYSAEDTSHDERVCCNWSILPFCHKRNSGSSGKRKIRSDDQSLGLFVISSKLNNDEFQNSYFGKGPIPNGDSEIGGGSNWSRLGISNAGFEKDYYNERKLDLSYFLFFFLICSIHKMITT